MLCNDGLCARRTYVLPTVYVHVDWQPQLRHSDLESRTHAHLYLCARMQHVYMHVTAQRCQQRG